MSRWRPPAKPSAPYITAAGFRRLEDESRGLWDRRSEVVTHLAAAAAEGDRSENAEYIYRKKELRELDRRIGYLQRRMPKLKIVESVPADTSKVFFGAYVTLADEDGEETLYRIVGTDEADAANGWVSVDSPIAKAVLGKSVDDEVVVRTGDERKHYDLVEIEYRPDK